MVDHASRSGRRRFLRLAVAGAAALPLCGALAKRLRAQEQVSEDDELSEQLGYTHDASEVDPGEWPTYEDGQTCANCQLFEGDEGDEWAPCQIFGGDLVAAAGWCSAWVPRES